MRKTTTYATAFNERLNQNFAYVRLRGMGVPDIKKFKELIDINPHYTNIVPSLQMSLTGIQILRLMELCTKHKLGDTVDILHAMMDAQYIVFLKTTGNNVGFYCHSMEAEKHVKFADILECKKGSIFGYYDLRIDLELPNADVTDEDINSLLYAYGYYTGIEKRAACTTRYEKHVHKVMLDEEPKGEDDTYDSGDAIAVAPPKMVTYKENGQPVQVPPYYDPRTTTKDYGAAAIYGK